MLTKNRKNYHHRYFSIKTNQSAWNQKTGVNESESTNYMEV